MQKGPRPKNGKKARSIRTDTVRVHLWLLVISPGASGAETLCPRQKENVFHSIKHANSTIGFHLILPNVIPYCNESAKPGQVIWHKRSKNGTNGNHFGANFILSSQLYGRITDTKIRSWRKRGLSLKIAIIDDDAQVCEGLRCCLNDLLGAAAQIDTCQSGEAFLAKWEPGTCDLVILDIFMPGITGLEVARQMRKTDREVKIAFSTTSNDFASESYEVNACYYLRKPFGIDRVKAMLDRLDLEEIEKMRAVKLPDGTSTVLRNIIYVDFALHRVTLHCKDGKNVAVRSNFSEVEPLLCAYPYFFSPTKGVIVNFYEVEAQNGDTFKMRDGSMIPISRRKAKEALDAYSSFLFRQLRKGGEA
mgnify:CR=1 FL=1